MGIMALWRSAELSRSLPLLLSSKRVSNARVSRQAGRPSAMKLLRDTWVHKHATGVGHFVKCRHQDDH